MGHRWLSLALAAAVAACLTACGDGREDGRAGGRGESGPVIYHRGNTAEPASLDPHRMSGLWESHIARDLFVGLMTDAADGSVIYGAAQSHTVSADGKSYMFSLRPDHRWSDGTPVTAEDFVYSFRRMLDPATKAQYAALLYPIAGAQAVHRGVSGPERLGVSAPDPMTVRIDLAYPAPFLLEMLTHQATYPVPRHVIAAHGADWTEPGVMVSNGPYLLKAWRANDALKLAKNPEFYDAQTVQIDTVYYYPTDDIPAALRRFRRGKLDTNNDFPIQRIDWLQKNLPEETRVHPSILTEYVTFNTRVAPFDNRSVRMALAMTIDRGVIAKEIMRTGNEPAYALVPPGIVNYPHTARFGWADRPYEVRLDEARRIMEAAGYGPDTPLKATYRYRRGVDNRRRAVAMAAMWKDIWVDLQLTDSEVGLHYADLGAGNFQIADAGWVADYNDPKNYLFLLNSSTGQFNYGAYANGVYDALLERADQTADAAERGRILAEAEQIMLDDAPIAPLVFATSRNLVARHVLGFVDNAEDQHPTRFLRIDRSR